MNGLAAAWRAERTKALATKGWLTWGLAIFVTAAGVSALLGVLIVSLGPDDGSGPVHEQDTARSVYSSPLTLCYLMSLAAGVGVYARERRQVSLPMTLLITARRSHVILAKYLLGLTLGTWCGVAYLAGILVGGGTILFTHGEAVVPTMGVARTLAVLVSLFALWCTFGVGLGMCLSVMPALLTGFALALVLPVAFSPMLGGSPWGRKIINLFPGIATNASTEPFTGDAGVLWLPWWGSYAVLVLWVLLVALLGVRAVLRAEIDVD